MTTASPIASVDDDLRRFDESVEFTSSIRKKLVSKLESVVDSLSFDKENMTARDIEVRVGAINALDSILKSHESSHASKVKVKLQNKGLDLQNDVKGTIVEALKNISVTIGNKNTSPVIATDSVDHTKLEDIVKENCEPISEDELTECTKE